MGGIICCSASAESLRPRGTSARLPDHVSSHLALMSTSTGIPVLVSRSHDRRNDPRYTLCDAEFPRSDRLSTTGHKNITSAMLWETWNDATNT